MASRKLKVFRTAIGFHDAYVAVPSRKAALEAWGSERNLFAMGAAEPVEGGPFVEKALAAPGEVIKVARGTADQHIAALPMRNKKKAPASSGGKTRPTVAPEPRPSRAAIDRAEKAVRDAEQARESELERLDRQIAALTAERRAARAAHDEKLAKARSKLSEAEDHYNRRLDSWSNQ